MKVIVVGLGSMGKRRIKLLQQLDRNVEIVGVDTNEDRREEASRQFGIHTSDNLLNYCQAGIYEAAFICTAPLSHAELIDLCLEYSLHIFTEINVVADEYEKLIEKAKDKNCILFLSSTMLYRKEIQYIQEKVRNYIGTINYNYHVGQYLPDWHPWETYKDFFVKEVRTNGCRELFAIELPWLVNTFGKVIDLHVQKSKMTKLDIAYNDNYIVSLTHETGHKGILMLDVVTRKAIRRIELIGEELSLIWEGKPDTLKEYDLHTKQETNIETYDAVNHDSRYSHNIIENAYTDEIKHFMEVISHHAALTYSFQQDQEILDLIDCIEQS